MKTMNQKTETAEETNPGFSVSAEELEAINRILSKVACVESHLASLRIDNLESEVAAATLEYRQSPSNEAYQVLEQNLQRLDLVRSQKKLALALNFALDHTLKELVPIVISITSRGHELYRERLIKIQATEQARHKELFGGEEPLVCSRLIDQAKPPVTELKHAMESLQHAPGTSSIQSALALIHKYAVTPSDKKP